MQTSPPPTLPSKTVVTLPLGENNTPLQVILSDLTVPILKDYCTRLHIKVSTRRKAAYIQALANFDPKAPVPESTRAAYVRPHKGPRQNVANKKGTARSALRWLGKTGHVEGSNDADNAANIGSSTQDLQKWADSVLAFDDHEHPSPDPSSRHQSEHAIDFHTLLGSPDILEKTMVNAFTKCLSGLLQSTGNDHLLHAVASLTPSPSPANNIAASVEGKRDRSSKVVDAQLLSHAVASLTPSPSPANNIAASVEGKRDHSSKVVDAQLLSNFPARCQQAYSAPELVPKPRVLMLAGNKKFNFTTFEVPELPHVTPTNIKYLASIWDDDVPSWTTSPLIINDTPIAMKYWPKVYRNLFPGSAIWKGSKQNWRDCKLIVEEYLRLGDASFWNKWTVNGMRVKTEKIKECLRKERKDAEDLEYKQILERDPSFVASQCYTNKSGVQQVISKSSLVKRYRMIEASSHTPLVSGGITTQ